MLFGLGSVRKDKELLRLYTPRNLWCLQSRSKGPQGSVLNDNILTEGPERTASVQCRKNPLAMNTDVPVEACANQVHFIPSCPQQWAQGGGFQFGAFAGEPPVRLLNRRAGGSAISFPASLFHLGWLLPPSTLFWPLSHNLSAG